MLLLLLLLLRLWALHLQFKVLCRTGCALHGTRIRHSVARMLRVLWGTTIMSCQVSRVQ